MCIDELKSLYGDEASCYSTLKNWFNEFNCGRRTLKDEVRADRPKTALVPDNIDAVFMQHRRVTYREIEPFLAFLLLAYMYLILHERLIVKKIYSRWMPQNLTIAQNKVRA